MTPASPAPTERIVLLLQRAADGGAAVLIPGAWEPSAFPPAVIADPGLPSGVPHAAVVANAVAADRPDAAGLVARLQRAVVRLIDVLVSWSRVRPSHTP